MRARCPGAEPLGIARLEDFRLIVMRDGWASVRPVPGAVVHGLLWRLAPSDVPPLDAFEDVAAGLYTKTVRTVLHEGGSTPAFLYVGHTTDEGAPQPGYLPAVLAAAQELGLPAAHLRHLEALALRRADPP